MQTFPNNNMLYDEITQGLSPDQLIAFYEGLDFTTQWHSLTGFSGVGKTLLVAALFEAYKIAGREFFLAATTNKACAVLAEKIGNPVPTWQSFLGYTLRKQSDGQMALKKNCPSKLIEAATLAIDEAGMVSYFDLKNILKEVEDKNARVLFIGDPWQLLPIKGSSSPALTGAHSKSRLTTLHRQAEGNPIIELSHAFRRVIDGAPFPDVAQFGDAENG